MVKQRCRQHGARATVDMDLARQDNEEAASADFRAVELAEVGDHFTFRVQRTARLDDADVAGTVRYRVRAELAGRLFEEFQVDVGFADPPVAAPDEVAGPDLLGFAELAPVRAPLLPLPQHVAEKVHAYTGTYGPRRTASTRVKDLVDLALLSAASPFRADELRSALVSTFAARGTHPLPRALPEPPSDWRVPYRSLATGLAVPGDLAEGPGAAAAFLDPVLGERLADGARWEPATRAWSPPPRPG
jgi:hypothetical protein